jgi:hypothetical protein
MVASAKSGTKAVAKRAAKVPATPRAKADPSGKPAARSKPSAGPSTAEPSLRFHHSKELRAKTHAVLAALEAAPDHARHRTALADLVAELTEVGMDYYYIRALRVAQVGFVGEQSARLGVSGAAKLISSVSRKYIMRMDDAQLLIVARHVRELA